MNFIISALILAGQIFAAAFLTIIACVCLLCAAFIIRATVITVALLIKGGKKTNSKVEEVIDNDQN